MSVVANSLCCTRDAISRHVLQQTGSILLVYVNGYFMPTLSNLSALPEKIIACSPSDASGGAFISIPDHTELTLPVHLLCITQEGNAFLSETRNEIHVGKHSKLTLIEEHIAFSDIPYTKNIVTMVHAKEQSKLDYYKIQHESSLATHTADTSIFQHENSQVVWGNFSCGGQLARDEVKVELNEQGASCQTLGFYRLKKDGQSIENHVTINHKMPSTHSDMLFRGILDNKSRAVFKGRLHVAKDAAKIVAHQANHNMVLSNSAEVYSKPELEIYADDVKCKHGATIGQLDQDALFYLRSRGINQAEATKLLLHGFADDVMQRISHDDIKSHIQKMVSCQ